MPQKKQKTGEGKSGEAKAKPDAIAAQLTQAIFDTERLLVVVLDAEGRIRRFNKSAEKISGYSFNEIEGKFPWETFLPADEAETVYREGFQALVNNPESLVGHYSNYWQHRDGRRFLTEWFNTVLLDENQHVEFVVAVGLDITKRKVAEEALRESEQRFRTLFDNAPESIVVVDADDNNRFVDANENACQLYGLDREELLKCGPADLSPFMQPNGQLSSELAMQKIQGALDGEVQHFEWTHRNAKGDDIPCEVYLVRLPSASRRLLRGSVVDISERVSAHKQICESEEIHRAICEASPDAIVMTDQKGIITFASATAADVFRLNSIDDLLGVPVIDLIAPQDLDRAKQNQKDRFEGKDVGVVEYQLRRQDGSEFPAELNVSVLHDDDGNPTGVVGLVRDITIRRQAEQSLVASEKLHRAMIEASPDAIVVTDAEGVITFASPDLYRMFELTSADGVIGSSVLQWVVDEERDKAIANMKKRMSGEEIGVSEYKLLRKGKAPFYAEINVSVLKDEASNPTGMVAFVRDVSKRKQAEQQQVDLARVVEDSLNEVYIIDQQSFKFIRVNGATRNNLGYSDEEFAQMTPLDISPEYSIDSIKTLVAPLLSGQQQELVFETNHRRKDGTLCPTELHVQTGTYMERPVFITIANDITERKQAQRKLIESEATHRALIEASPDAIAMTDDRGIITFASPRFLEIFGLDSMEEAVGTSTQKWVIAEDSERAMKHLRGELQGRHLGSIELRLVRKDGSVFSAEISSSVLYDDNNKVTGVFGLVRDISARKQAEQQQADLARVVEESLNEVLIFNRQSLKIVKANHAARKNLGYSEEELSRLTPLNITVGETPETLSELLAPLLVDQRQALAAEKTHRRKDGTHYIADLRIQAGSYDGQPVIVLIANDITERKEAESLLRESEQKYRELVEHANSIILRWSRDGRITFMNEYGQRFFGYSEDEIINRHVIGTIVPETESSGRDLQPLIMDICADPKKFEQNINENIKRNGERAWVAWTNKVLMDEDGQVSEILSIGTDITESKQAKQEQERVSALLTSAIEQSPSGILIADAPDVSIRMANTAAFNIRGGDKKVLTGIDVSQHTINWQTLRADGSVYPSEELPLSRAVLKGETTTNEEMIIQDADGERHWVNVNAAPIRDASEKVIAGVVVFHDISERKRAEEERLVLERQIQHAQKLESLGVLAGGIAHDFNNLLTSILGFSDLALMQLDSDSTAAEYIGHVVDGGKKAADLAKQMLAYSGKGQFDIRLLDLSKLVTDISGLLEISVSKKCILKYDFAKEIPLFEGDATQIRQVIMNLVINASDAIDVDNGVITVRTGEMDCDEDFLKEVYLDAELPPGTYVFLEVSDTGMGMTKEDKEKIFDPFFTTKFTGRGLGLAAVLGIVRGHRGAIKVYSEPGEGSVFKVLFPVSKKEMAKEESRPLKQVAWQGHGTVLVIDDEPSVCGLAQQMLETIGFNVVVAFDGEQGVELYRQQPQDIDLVLLDMTMPKMDGVETFAELKKVNADVRVVLSSGYNQQTTEEKFAEQDLAGFIQKPYQLSELAGVMRKVLGE